MTIDERLEFLVQSTESLHETIREQNEQLRRHDERLRKQEQNWERVRRSLRAALEAWLDEDDQNGNHSN